MADVQIIDKSPKAALDPTDSFAIQESGGTTYRLVASNLGLLADGVLKTDTDTAITLTTQNTWYGWVYATAGLYHNMTADVSATTPATESDTIEPDTGFGGTYDVDFFFSAMNEGAQSADIEMMLSINGSPVTGTTTDMTVSRTFAAGTSGSGGTGDRVALSAGDTIGLWIRATNSSNRELTILDGTVIKLTRLRA